MTSRPTNWVNCCSRCRVELRWVQLSWVDLSCVAINTTNGSFISWKFDDAIAVVVLQWCNKHHSKQERPKQYLTGWWRGRQRIGRSIQRLGTAPLSLIYNNPPPARQSVYLHEAQQSQRCHVTRRCVTWRPCRWKSQGHSRSFEITPWTTPCVSS